MLIAGSSVPGVTRSGDPAAYQYTFVAKCPGGINAVVLTERRPKAPTSRQPDDVIATAPDRHLSFQR